MREHLPGQALANADRYGNIRQLNNNLNSQIYEKKQIGMAFSKRKAD